jgi:hypothetical protein
LFLFTKQTNPNQSKKEGQLYSDTSPFIIPWLNTSASAMKEKKSFQTSLLVWIVGGPWKPGASAGNTVQLRAKIYGRTMQRSGVNFY